MSDPEPEPPWLDAEQLAAWRGFMNLAQRLPAALDSALQQDSRLSFVEYHVLVLLADETADRRMRMSRLAALANIELSRLSHLMNRLEKRGFLSREPDPTDGRYTNAVLTDAGHAYLTQAAPDHVRRVRELFVDVLDREELQTLYRCALKVTARIDGS